MRCYVTHELTERFAEHRDQCGAVDDGRALKSGGDDCRRCEAQRDSDCSAQRAFGAGEHASELSCFHDVFHYVCLVAVVRNLYRKLARVRSQACDET